MRDIFLGWEEGWDGMMCGAGKERCGKPKTYTCANILQSKAAAFCRPGQLQTDGCSGALGLSR